DFLLLGHLDQHFFFSGFVMPFAAKLERIEVFVFLLLAAARRSCQQKKGKRTQEKAAHGSSFRWRTRSLTLLMYHEVGNPSKALEVLAQFARSGQSANGIGLDP